MNIRRTFKVVVGATSALGATAGLTAAIISCASTSNPLGTYYYPYQSSLVTNAFKADTDKNLIVWLPYARNQTQQVDKVTPAIEKLLVDAGYKVEFKDTPAQNYGNAPTTLVNLVQAGGNELALFPDIIVNYPDIQAIIESYGLAQDFNGLSGANIKDLIQPAMSFDLHSVFTATPGVYAVPFLKSTDILMFDVPAFGMILNEVAKLHASDPSSKVTLPGNSAQLRLFKMILANSVSPYTDKGIYENSADTDFSWKNVADAWTDKTKAGGAWEADAKTLAKNFSTSAANLKDLLKINWSNPIFADYNSLADTMGNIASVFVPASDNPGGSVLSADSASNTIYSYQYDASGHSDSTFFINPQGSDSSPRLVFDFNPGTVSGSALVKAADYVSGLINKRVLWLKGPSETSYSTSRLQNHATFLALGSSNGTTFVTADASKPALLNPGEVYFDLQPTKASSSETKRSLINQGPSLFVTRVHSTQSAKIAQLFKDAIANGVFSAKPNNLTEVDDGVFGPLGYIYSDVKSYAPAAVGAISYYDMLKNQMNSPSGWMNSAAKFLLADYLRNADANGANSFNNLAGPNTSLLRKQFDTAYGSYAASNGAPSGSSALASIANYFVADAKLRTA